MDILISLIFFVVAFCFLRLSRAIYDDMFSPIGVFGFIQCFGLSMFHLKLYPYNPLSQFAWLSFLGALFFFMLGCILVSGVMKSMEIQKIDVASRLDSRRLLRITVFSFIMGFIGFIIMLVNLLFNVSFKAMANDPMALREKVVLPIYIYPWFFNVLTPSLAILYVKITGRCKVRMSLVAVAALLMLFLSFSRSLGITAVFMAFLTVSNLQIIKKPFKTAVITALVGFSIFTAFHVFIKAPDALQRVEHSSFTIKSMSFLAPAYGYFTSGFSTFDPYVADTKSYDYGMNTFITIVKLLRLVDDSIKLPGVHGQWEVHGQWYANPIRSNVYTYLGIYYRDFGVLGVLILPLLQGILVTIPYLLMRRYGHYNLILLNGLFSWCLLISFFSNHFRGNTTFFLAIVSILIGKFISRRREVQVPVA